MRRGPEGVRQDGRDRMMGKGPKPATAARQGARLRPGMAFTLVALAIGMAPGWAAAEAASLRPKPRPAVESASAPTPKSAPDAAQTGEEGAIEAADGAALPAPPAAEAGPAAAPEDAPPLAAPAPLPDAKPAAPPRDPNKGSVTNLPLPRYVSLKGKEGNARRGPGQTHRIDWVFVHGGMPLRVTGEYEHWRRIEDSEGAGGWIHYAFLSGVRTAQVVTDMADFHAQPSDDALVLFRAEKDVVGRIQECEPDWCRLSIDGERGWVRKSALWGVDPGEIIN